MKPTRYLSLTLVFAALLGLFGGSCGSNVALAQVNLSFDIEEPPFEYTETADNNRVSRLIAKLKSKEIKLEYTREQGYLPAMLEALQIPASSQTLVFSKTSMQVRYISPRNPRAIYFNDDTYVGWVRGSSLMELSTVDPKLGAAFYTVDMMPWRAKIERASYDCLGCHVTSMTQGVPGHTVRSVLPNVDGSVNAQTASSITSHSSPLSQRWGGWYVTGRHGEMTHQGNALLRGDRLDTHDNGNRLNLRDEFDTYDYLSPYSDIVALMVLEHQSQMHNTMTRADFSVRQLQHERAERDPTTESEDEWRAQLHMIAEPVAREMLFCGETKLTSEVKGLLEFAHEFENRGPSDDQGRSIRQFDLKTRMFKYPLSYLIYSEAFDSLSEDLRGEVVRQLLDVLEERDTSETYAHLTKDMRRDILEILRATKPGFERDAS